MLETWLSISNRELKGKMRARVAQVVELLHLK